MCIRVSVVRMQMHIGHTQLQILMQPPRPQCLYTLSPSSIHTTGTLNFLPKAPQLLENLIIPIV